MTSQIRSSLIIIAVIGAYALVLSAAAEAHGGGNWNAFRIDAANDDAREQALATRDRVANIIRGRGGNEVWNEDSFREARDSLITVKEVVDEILEHYVADGVNLDSAPALKNDPRAGRTVAASRALSASIALLEYAPSLPTQNEFIDEFYASGPSSLLYELIGAHVDRMDLYELVTPPEE